jgi:competence protein ComGC
MINIHAATHLLVATGSEAYVQMVESVVEAYRPKDQLIEMKPSKEK